MAITSEQLTPWQRRLVPGLTELLFVLLFLSQLDARLFSEVTGLHLWAGLEALRHGPGLLPDTLSFTRQGALWLNPEWLGDVVLALAWRHAAYLGVAVLCALVFAGTFTWLYRILVDETDQPAVSLMVTLLAAAVAYLHLAARPSTLVLPLLLAAWELTRKPRPEWAAFALPALAALWANVHPSVLVVPLLAGYAALTHSRGPRGWIIAVLCLGRCQRPRRGRRGWWRSSRPPRISPSCGESMNGNLPGWMSCASSGSGCTPLSRWSRAAAGPRWAARSGCWA